jgi:hypothetical protein
VIREAPERVLSPADVLVGEVPGPVEPTAPSEPDGPTVPDPTLPGGPVAPPEPATPADPAPQPELPQPTVPDEVPGPDGRSADAVLGGGAS